MAEVPRLVLASSSAARRAILSAAGIDFEVMRPEVDEAEIRRSMYLSETNVSAERIADSLARAKAQSVGRSRPNALVIGSDQVLACDGEILTKPADLTDARRSLVRLRGRRHRLISAVALVQAGEADWAAVDAAELEMRSFSDAFLDDYLARHGDSLLSSVGAYQLEGRGIQLFACLSGDYFTILGLPLLPLLTELRRRGALAA